MQIDPRLPDVAHRVVVAVLMVLGSVCLGLGVAIATCAGWAVFLLVEDPRRFGAVSYLIELSSKSLRAAHGNIDGRAFQVDLGEPVFWLAFLVAGVLLLGVVAGLAKTLVTMGVELITRGLAEMRRPPADKAP